MRLPGHSPTLLEVSDSVGRRRLRTSTDNGHYVTARARPQQIVIYHAGSGKIAFIGMMRLSTILIFVVSCTVVAPAFYAADYPWYIPPASK